MKLFYVYTVILGLTVLFLILYFYKIPKNESVIGILKRGKLPNHEDKIKEILQCYEKPLKFSIQEKKNYWVFYNFVRAEQTHKCHESITFTTVGDFLHIENLIPTVERWNGPVSVALHAVGDDFYRTIDSIAYLRNCESSLVKKFVTFHIVMDYDHFPKPKVLNKQTIPLSEVYEDKFNCSQGPPYLGFQRKDMFKTEKNVKFPINVLRNVARESAQTHFVLAADIELYPSENVIKHFLHMVVAQRNLFTADSKKVYVLPIFEVESNQKAPTDKKTLIEMYNNKTAIMFHEKICYICHVVPKFSEWLKLPIGDKFNVFSSSKRKGKFKDWEPFYISTNNEPFFEERINWENGGDKMTQNYKQCLLDYDYCVLDNAFFVHKPGIKRYDSKNPDKRREYTEYSKIRLNSEYNQLFGERNGC